MTDPLFDVAGKIILISGASRGIGLAIARGFAERGARVIITGRDPETLEPTAREIGGIPMVCDVGDTSQSKSLIEKAWSELGPIDVLINCAGVNSRKKVETFTPDEYDFILDINLKGPFFLSQALAVRLIESGHRASIINIDSLNTYAPLKGVLPYAMSKAGMSMMTRGMATEWGGHGIRVNAIAPGFILTDMTRKLWSQPTMKAWGDANTPLQRLGEVGDLVGAAIFLASPASAFMTGQVIYVDGGFSAGILWPIPLG